MRFLTISLLFFSIFVFSQNDLSTPFERGNGNQSTTYEDCISFYEQLDERFANIQMIYKGTTDSGKPLHLVLFSSEGKFDFDEYFTKTIHVLPFYQEQGKVVKINGIGEVESIFGMICAAVDEAK